MYEEREGDCIKEFLDYQIPKRYLQHQVVYDDPTMEHKDILLNLHVRHILGLARLLTLDAQIINVGPYYHDCYNEHLDPAPGSNYSIRIPASILPDRPTVETYILAHLPPLSEILDAHLDVEPMLTYASDICYDASSRHVNFIIYGNLYVIKSEMFYEKNVLQKECVFDYDDEYLNCAICLNGLAGGIECSRTLCGHVFHKSCLFPWMEMKNTCPMCREFIVRVGCIFITTSHSN